MSSSTACFANPFGLLSRGRFQETTIGSVGMNGGFQSHLSEGQGDLDKVVVEEIAEMRDTKIQDTSW